VQVAAHVEGVASTSARLEQQLQQALPLTQTPFSPQSGPAATVFILGLTAACPQVNGSMHDLVSSRLAQALVKERQLLQQARLRNPHFFSYHL
jgi:hypothetical protein